MTRRFPSRFVAVTAAGDVMVTFQQAYAAGWSLDGLPEGATAVDVAEAHAADLRVQERFGVRYLNYWVDEGAGKSFCLIEAPSADAAHAVHREAHGLVADEIYPVTQG